MAVQHFGLLAHGLGTERLDDVAVVDDGDAVGESHCGGNVLLHDQNGLAGLRQRAAGGEEIAHDDRGEALERFVEQQDLGSRASARAIASICCSPPERSVPRLARRSLSRGNMA
jgi:hypothetical protein